MKNLSLLSLIIFLCFACTNTGEQRADAKKTTANKKTEATRAASSENTSKTKYILFFGDSITAGYGLEEKDALTTLIQNRIKKMNLDYKVVNAGLSGETTAGGARRIDWVLKQKVDLFVLELGGNDMLRGLDVNATEENLRTILKKVRAKHPKMPIIIAGMMAPPNMGKAYQQKFNSLFADLAKEFDAGFIPFVLEGVAGNPKLNLPDGIHPNVKGEKIVADNIWKVLKDFL